jgi:hypothetical protein
VAGQHLVDLRERPGGRLLDAGDPRRGAQPDRDGDRLVVVEQQRGEVRADAEPVEAGRAAFGVDRIAGSYGP